MTRGRTAGAKGQNAYLGFDAALGRVVATAPSRWVKNSANSEAFAACQVKKVFRAVCLRDPEIAADRSRGRDSPTRSVRPATA